jgi:hypothetical protein
MSFSLFIQSTEWVRGPEGVLFPSLRPRASRSSSALGLLSSRAQFSGTTHSIVRSKEKEVFCDVVEGLNSKAELSTRKAYGFRTFKMLQVALYHALGNLHEPDSTQEFF